MKEVIYKNPAVFIKFAQGFSAPQWKERAPIYKPLKSCDLARSYMGKNPDWKSERRLKPAENIRTIKFFQKPKHVHTIEIAKSKNKQKYMMFFMHNACSKVKTHKEDGRTLCEHLRGLFLRGRKNKMTGLFLPERRFLRRKKEQDS